MLDTSAGGVSIPEWFQGRKSKFYSVEELPTFSGLKDLWVESAKLTPTLTHPRTSPKGPGALTIEGSRHSEGFLKNMAQDPHSLGSQCLS